MKRGTWAQPEKNGKRPEPGDEPERSPPPSFDVVPASPTRSDVLSGLVSERASRLSGVLREPGLLHAAALMRLEKKDVTESPDPRPSDVNVVQRHAKLLRNASIDF